MKAVARMQAPCLPPVAIAVVFMAQSD